VLGLLTSRTLGKGSCIRLFLGQKENLRRQERTGTCIEARVVHFLRILSVKVRGTHAAIVYRCETFYNDWSPTTLVDAWLHCSCCCQLWQVGAPFRRSLSQIRSDPMQLRFGQSIGVHIFSSTGVLHEFRCFSFGRCIPNKVSSTH
jgi:hypothetical protein